MIDPNVSTAMSDLKISEGEDPEVTEEISPSEGACALPPN